MRKVVINACFGGFGLSHAATLRYAEIKGFKLYAYVLGRKPDGSLDLHNLDPYTPGERAFCVHYYKEPTVNRRSVEGARFSDNSIPRDDPTLVQVIEEMGEKANGSHARLRIVEIPDDVEWHIHEYDGSEHVAENHRTWYGEEDSRDE